MIEKIPESKPERSLFMKVGDMELDQDKQLVRRGGREIPLNRAEFKVLELLMSYPGRVFPGDVIFRYVWGEAADIRVDAVASSVARLRREINRVTEKDPIRTIKNVGYSFDETYGTEKTK